MAVEFEDIADNLERAKVFGGWLVRHTEDVYHQEGCVSHASGNGWDWRVSLTFVPDPKHEWNVE